MSTYSKYNQIKTGRVPHRKRTIKVQGAGDDDGKFYRCWNCGFINNIDRNSIADGWDSEGLTYSVTAITPDRTLTGSQLAITAGVTGSIVMVGTVPHANDIQPDAVGGCSFCGCLNWR